MLCGARAAGSIRLSRRCPAHPLRRNIDNDEAPVVKIDDAGLVGNDRTALVSHLDTLIERDLLGFRGSSG